MNTKKIVIGMLVVGAIIVVGLFYSFKKTPSNTDTPPPPSPPAQNQDNQTGVEGIGDYTVKVEPVTPISPIPKPDLDRAIVVSDKSLTGDAANTVIANLKIALAAAKKNAADYQAWMDIGLYRKAIGDYQGSSEAWLYVLNFQKQNFVVMNNLANLYAQNLKDYSKAEKYYLAFITEQQSNVDGYINLYQLYRNQYKEKSIQASEILKQGIAKIPDSITLMIELARYYKTTNDVKSARTYYEQAIAVAVKNKNTEIEKSLREELAGLPN
ncbi:MAG: tetratricopeptide repeat protein [Patescibacteria group bacterium]